MQPQSNQIQDVENNFTKGLITEFTGLNFPANAATDTNNCVYTLVGDVTRRPGINYEANYGTNFTAPIGKAISAYKWNNVGGDGLTQIVVEQVGPSLYFYKSSASTVASPVSQNLIGSLAFSGFIAVGGSFDLTLECQYADGNGYLFVYHPSCDPIYCTYNAGTITAAPIPIQIRDFTGVAEVGVPVNNRPASLSQEHLYNLTNQGWSAGNPYQAVASVYSNLNLAVGVSGTYTVAAGLGAANGDTVTLTWIGSLTYSNGFVSSGTILEGTGTVTGYSGTTLTVLPTSIVAGINGNFAGGTWLIIPTNHGYIDTWHSDLGNYPSNADVWWYFKDSTNLFNPTTTITNVTLATGNAPQGHVILNAFNQQRTATTGITGITDIKTTVRPRAGCWFQGRVWYTGVDAQQPATGDAGYYTWTENIYFSKIVQTVNDFGLCYQTNDPTSENLFDLLPTDGGIINIPGSGSIYKLFPLQNALLVFAANGVWYITGSSGIGFSANDYTIVKLSSVRSISSTSFVDVNGLPIFWNEEGIYQVESAKQGTSLLNSPLHVNPLDVSPLTVGTILSFYNEIPTVSKRYVHGAYDPINYVVQWVYRSTEETSVNNRYLYDSVLNFNTANKAFYPYSVDNSTFSAINGIIYIDYPGGTNTPESNIKFIASGTDSLTTFAEEYDTTYVDWAARTPVSFTSYFVTGYKLQGQGQRRFQVPYLYVYSRETNGTVAYTIQSIWDFATSANSGRWSTKQVTNISDINYGMLVRRHRLRGRGLVFQIKVTSVPGQPFDIMGWSAFDIQNLGI